MSVKKRSIGEAEHQGKFPSSVGITELHYKTKQDEPNSVRVHYRTHIQFMPMPILVCGLLLSFRFAGWGGRWRDTPRWLERLSLFTAAKLT